GRDVLWPEPDGREFATRPVDSEHPLFIAYTSGTTGRPKGSVHVHGGFLVNIAAELAFMFDLSQNDTLFCFTDMGWIMGPWATVPGHQHLGRYRGRRLLPRTPRGRADQADVTRRAGARHGRRRVRRRRPAAAGPRRRARVHPAVARDDPRPLQGPGALPRD